MIPPWGSVIFLWYPPPLSPSWMQYLSHARRLPLLSPVLRPIYLYRHPVILQNLSLSLLLWWRWYLWKCKYFLIEVIALFEWVSLNLNQSNYDSQSNFHKSQWELSGKTNKLRETREKRDQVAIGFSFESDWIRKWREFSGPITQRSEAKTMQSRIPSTLSWKLLTLYHHSHFLTNFWYPFVHSGVPGTTLDPTPV